MKLATILQMIIFANTMSISPGPCNIIAASQGSRYGFVNTIPFILGASLSIAGLILLTGLWLNDFASRSPNFIMTLKFLGGSYLLFQAISMIFSKGEVALFSDNGRLTFISALFMQVINPMVWLGAVAGVASFVTSTELLLPFVAIELVFSATWITIWVVAGERIARFLSTPSHRQLFNGALGVTLGVMSVYLMIH